ncbi:N-acetyltransferase [Xenorhabdus mauleonii]|uniref:N-acetyltransferase n=1 Tax=Xenorhabdus mauleonii TaxID=351675 RepID=A0A1I3VLB4_9GAMM|nr:hypothetical protein [Xenorhabdus mauleonii]PHM37405.1 N-acetyltransferase [Xenorhabdus mauleonii]SFJ96035.1 hypothetical protein SAMN05421680_12158 [Xenorhabdus mauleonii]
MMFRSNSFNINHPSLSGSLSRSKSVPDMGLASFDIRMFIRSKEVSAAEARNAADLILTKTMKDSEWPCDMKAELLDDEQKRWNDRYHNAYGIFRTIDINFTYFDDFGKEAKFFVIYYKNVPIGISMCTPKMDHVPSLLELDYFGLHCGMRNCGYLFMEYMVNKSHELGLNGRLKISPIKGTERFYINMGFAPFNTVLDNAEAKPSKSDNLLYLNPSENSKWHIINGKYKYIGC